MIIFTDLDGTLLEEDGSLAAASRAEIDRLRAKDIPVVPLTSKTRRELARWLEILDAGHAGAFENGAGILRKGESEVLPGALPVRGLRGVLEALRREIGLPLFSFEEIPDGSMNRLTGLSPGEAEAARDREFDLPFVAPADAAAALTSLRLPPGVRLTRGGRFWHLSGAHDKGDACRLLAARLGGGPTIGLGDAPNDAPFLRLVDQSILLPRAGGIDAELAALVPRAACARAASGAGWAAAVRAALGEAEAA
jgi:mannosyl-3-phosphoglycerate phosphatase